MTWRRDRARVGAWEGTPGKPVEAGTAKAQLHLPSRWNWLSEEWTGGHAHRKTLPWPGSCPSPEQGMGAQDPRYIALSLGVPSGIPGLVCLEPAPYFFCTPAAPPALPLGLNPHDTPSRLPGTWDRLTRCFFSIAPLPSNHPHTLGSPQLQGCHSGSPAALLQPPLAVLPTSPWSVKCEAANLTGLAAWTRCSILILCML